MWEQTLVFLVYAGSGVLILALFGFIILMIELAEDPEGVAEWWKKTGKP